MQLRVTLHPSTLTDNSSGRCPSRRFSTSFRSRNTKVCSIDTCGVAVLTFSDDTGSSSEPFRISTDKQGKRNKILMFYTHGTGSPITCQLIPNTAESHVVIINMQSAESSAYDLQDGSSSQIIGQCAIVIITSLQVSLQRL